MRGLNKAIIIGYVGKDPDIRHTQSGIAVANFSVATTENWKDKSGENRERTEWHNIVAWEGVAKVCDQYLRKGRQVYIEGKIQTRKWKDNKGNDRRSTEIVANNIIMLGPKEEQPSLEEAIFGPGPEDDDSL